MNVKIIEQPKISQVYDQVLISALQNFSQKENLNNLVFYLLEKKLSKSKYQIIFNYDPNYINILTKVNQLVELNDICKFFHGSILNQQLVELEYNQSKISSFYILIFYSQTKTIKEDINQLINLELKQLLYMYINNFYQTRQVATIDNHLKYFLCLINFNFIDNLGFKQIQNILKYFQLTFREKEIVEQLLQGYSNEKIAHNLYITVSTVKAHLTHIYDKLGVKTRQELISYLLSKQQNKLF